MNESKDNMFYAQNQIIYDRLFGASQDQRKDALDRLLLVNTGLITTAASKCGWRQYNIAEYEDILQTSRMFYIEIIDKSVSEGNKDYPVTIYPKLLRMLQEFLSRPYSNGGVGIPYSSRKVLQRADYEATQKIGQNDSYTNDSMEKQKMNQMESEMVKALTGMSMEDRICTSIVINNILKEQDEEARKIFENRLFNDLTYKEIAELLGISTDHARYVFNKLTALVKKELKL